MPQWLIYTCIVLMVLVVLGFFWLMFAEMGNKREQGRFTASRGTAAGGGRSSGKGRTKVRQRKSR
jgi:hypothetical protein